MKLRNIGILSVAALAIVAVAVLAWSSFGTAQDIAPTVRVGPTAYLPGASPTAGPGIAVQTRNVSTPTPASTPAATPSVTVTVMPTVTVVPTATAMPTPIAAQGQPSGQIVNYGTSQDTFKRGERATGFMTVKNTGNAVIKDITTSVSAEAKLPVVGTTSVGRKDYTFTDLNIQPGDTKRVEFTVDIPSEYMGVSTAGTYNLNVDVKTGDTKLGSFSKTVKVE